MTYGLDRPLSGVTRFTLELGQALAKLEGCEVFYLTPYRRGHFRDGARGVWLPGCSRLPALMMLGGPVIALAAKRLRLDVVHDPTGVSPFTLGRWAGRFKRLTTIHDAIAFRYPRGYPWLNNVLHRRYVPASLRHVDAVITDSEDARGDIAAFLRLPSAGVHVVPGGVSERFQPASRDAVGRITKRYGLDRPFVLALGAMQERKNHRRLLEAFVPLAGAYQLAICGPSQWAHTNLAVVAQELGIAAAVRLLGYVPDVDLPALYSAASVFAFPSLYEGFGLPPLEAMACGTPVVCSGTTALPEVAAGAAVLVDPLDVPALGAVLRRVIEDPAERDELRSRGLARARLFTWERSAAAALSVYNQVLAA